MVGPGKKTQLLRLQCTRMCHRQGQRRRGGRRVRVRRRAASLPSRPAQSQGENHLTCLSRRLLSQDALKSDGNKGLPFPRRRRSQRKTRTGSTPSSAFSLSSRPAPSREREAGGCRDSHPTASSAAVVTDDIILTDDHGRSIGQCVHEEPQARLEVSLPSRLLRFLLSSSAGTQDMLTAGYF